MPTLSELWSCITCGEPMDKSQTEKDGVIFQCSHCGREEFIKYTEDK